MVDSLIEKKRVIFFPSSLKYVDRFLSIFILILHMDYCEVPHDRTTL